MAKPFLKRKPLRKKLRNRIETKIVAQIKETSPQNCIEE